MINYAEHHLIASMQITNACLTLLTTLPKTDIVDELQDLLEENFDIVDCLLSERHFGSDELDCVINECQLVVAQIKSLESE